MTDDFTPASAEPLFEPLVVQFKPSMLTWIADRNPFFLISAVCMLWGCLAVTNSSSWMSVPLSRLLVLIGTLNFYELALIGLSLLLIHRGVLRDGKILLILEAFFLVDVAFLNAEVVTANLRVGLAVNSVLLLLALVKLWAIMRALGASLSPGRYLFIAAQLTMLMALPCVMRDIDHGAVPPIVFYAGWWAIAAMPVVGLLIERFSGGRETSITPMTRLYVVLPWISLAAHLGILHYSYDVPYFGAMASPMLLVLAVMLTRMTPNSFIRRKYIHVLPALLSLAAILVSGNEPAPLTFHLFGNSSLAISTLSVTAAGAYLTLIYCFLPSLARWLVPAGAIAAASYVFGPSADQISDAASRIWQRTVAITTAIMPKTTAGWGIVSVLASFFFLLVGAAISLYRPREEA